MPKLEIWNPAWNLIWSIWNEIHPNHCRTHFFPRWIYIFETVIHQVYWHLACLVEKHQKIKNNFQKTIKKNKNKHLNNIYNLLVFMALSCISPIFSPEGCQVPGKYRLGSKHIREMQDKAMLQPIYPMSASFFQQISGQNSSWQLVRSSEYSYDMFRCQLPIEVVPATKDHPFCGHRMVSHGGVV